MDEKKSLDLFINEMDEKNKPMGNFSKLDAMERKGYF
jgi:hypothetical protein